MRLEDLRSLLVGDSVLFAPDEPPLPMSFHEHAEQAQWHTLNAMVRFAGHTTDGVVSERIAVVEWWRTIESLVAMLHHIAVRESELGFRQDLPRLRATGKESFQDKWSAVPRWFGHEQESPAKEVTRLVLELRDFRNSFEHSSRQTHVDIRHSRLGSVPAHANLSDAMEALAICLLAMQVLRYVVSDHDLMPQAVVPSQQHAFFVPLDRLAGGLVFPTYHWLLKEAGLCSDVAPYADARPLSGRTMLRVNSYIKAHPDRADTQVGAPVDIWRRFEEFAAQQPEIPPPGAFRLPAYHAPSGRVERTSDPGKANG